MTRLPSNLSSILEKVDAAALRSGRSPSEIRLVAVTKRQSEEDIQEFLDLWPRERGLACLGENYLQEYQEKRERLRGDFKAHFIGTLQSKKAAAIAQCFDCIETLASRSAARALEQYLSQGAGAQESGFPVLLQVNISDDPGKSGFSPAELRRFWEEVLPECPSLDFQGLMTIPQYYEEATDVRKDFRALRVLSEEMRSLWTLPPGRCWPEPFSLSMGMSRDFEIAIEEGANIIRLGTLLFGERD